jgi:hypothetical protein
MRVKREVLAVVGVTMTDKESQAVLESVGMAAGAWSVEVLLNEGYLALRENFVRVELDETLLRLTPLAPLMEFPRHLPSLMTKLATRPRLLRIFTFLPTSEEDVVG